jgi:hypothetical protein
MNVIKLYKHDEITQGSHFSSINHNYQFSGHLQIIYTYTKTVFQQTTQLQFYGKSIKTEHSSLP